jgi:signal transduction histidine kinase
MREIALHIMDLIENSIRAEATTIVVAITADPSRDRLEIVIEDNGTGLKTAADEAMNPFCTTKSGKRTGLGLSLFRGAAEQTGGGLTIGKSDLGGVRVGVEMALRHVDRNPLGDLAGTLSAVVMTNPELDFRFRLTLGSRSCRIHVANLAAECDDNGRSAIALAQQVAKTIKAELERAQAWSGLAL